MGNEGQLLTSEALGKEGGHLADHFLKTFCVSQKKRPPEAGVGISLEKVCRNCSKTSEKTLVRFRG